MVLDIIIVIFILVSVVVGFKKGFTDTVLRLAGGIIALVLAFMLQGSVAQFITEQTGMDKQIAEGVKSSITKMLIKENTTPTKEQNDNTNFLTSAKLFADKYQDIKNSSGNERESKIDQWSMSVASFVVKGISFVAIFIAVSIVIMILRLILGGVMDLPVLKQLDGLAGLGAGFVLGIIQLLVIFAIISFISPMQIMSGINNLIEASTIAKIIYNNNFLVSIIASKIL